MLQKLFLLFTVMSILLTGCAKKDPAPEGSSDHIHQPAENAQTVKEPVSGYCGNTQTTVLYNEESYTFMSGPSVTLTDLLINLDYDPGKTCKCADYDLTVTTELGGPYYISLDEAYARCTENGYLAQADLTAEQLQTVREVLQQITNR